MSEAAHASVELVVYSDFLCPWCYNAAVRLERLERTLQGALTLQWKSYLLRPKPRSGRSLEKFRAYTESWLRVAADEPECKMTTWQGDAGPPSHSVPPHRLAKLAAAVAPDSLPELRRRLFEAYFAESRDISNPETLSDVWSETGLASEHLKLLADGEFEKRVFDDHREALELGTSGVPAVRRADQTFVLVGAQPLETYRRWVERISRETSDAAPSAAG